jgi:hypothetical protein
MSETDYNALPNVEDASRALQARWSDFQELHASASEAAGQLGAPGHLGILLLHRHWDLGSGLAMVEEPRMFGAKPALVTAPRSTSDGANPSRWRVDVASSKTDELWPLEYSTDRGVVATASELPEARQFLNYFAAIVQEMELDHLCGLCVTSRETLRAGIGELYVEESRYGESVVTVLPVGGRAFKGYIDTVWPLRTPERAGCRTKCVPTSSQRCVYDGTRHNQQFVYDHRPGHDYTPICQPTGCV